jgi:hypothetical protein
MMAGSNAAPRLLFCSYHCYVDPSSGAALATRDLMELLTAGGWACGVFTGPQLDYEAGESLAQILADYGHEPDTRRSPGGPAPFTVNHFHQGGLPVSVSYAAGMTVGAAISQFGRFRRAATNAGKELRALNLQGWNKGKGLVHFEKHGVQMGYASVAEYTEGAMPGPTHQSPTRLFEAA